jgi:hypothetical protein
MKTALKKFFNRPAVKGLSFSFLMIVAVSAGLLAALVVPVAVR